MGELDDIVRAFMQPPYPYDPYPLYGALRDAAPMYRADDGFWYASSYDAATAVFRSPALGQGSGPDSRMRRDPRFGDSAALRTLAYMLPFIDPPDHTRLRQLISRAFTPRAVERMRGYLERRVDGLLDRIETQGGGDIMADLADHIPVAVICEMLGAPDDRHGDLVEWADALVAAVHPTVSDEHLAHADHGAQQFRDYVDELIAQRRAEPRDDLLTALVEAERDGDRLDATELTSTVCVFIGAGIENTKHHIGAGVWWLLGHRGQISTACRDTVSFATAMDEVLRIEPPVQVSVPRLVLEDTELLGVALRKGEHVCPVVGGANRDPAAYPAPDTFDVTRHGPPNLSLASGAHFCTGAGLARLEAAVTVERFLRRFPDARLVDDPPPVRDDIRPSLRGYERLLVEVR
jgi:cytochrome P450